MVFLVCYWRGLNFKREQFYLRLESIDDATSSMVLASVKSYIFYLYQWNSACKKDMFGKCKNKFSKICQISRSAKFQQHKIYQSFLPRE